jgi:hypothetical protein
LVLPARAQTKGNGLPAGQKLLYNLEVIAYSANNCPSGDFTGSNTHRIAVKADVSDLSTTKGATASTLIRQNDILLAAGPFQVLSGNACATGTATFQLPANPCTDLGLNFPCSVDDPTFQNYAVYARLVGNRTLASTSRPAPRINDRPHCLLYRELGIGRASEK